MLSLPAEAQGDLDNFYRSIYEDVRLFAPHTTALIAAHNSPYFLAVINSLSCSGQNLGQKMLKSGCTSLESEIRRCSTEIILILKQFNFIII